MCYQETSDTESYQRVRIIHRRPATCPMPHTRRHCYSYRSSSSSCGSSRYNCYDDSDYDYESDSEVYTCRPRYSRTYYARPRYERYERYECRPSCSRPSYTTTTRTRTRTREETIYPARRELFDCEPVRRLCEYGRRYRIMWWVKWWCYVRLTALMNLFDFGIWDNLGVLGYGFRGLGLALLWLFWILNAFFVWLLRQIDSMEHSCTVSWSVPETF